MTITVPPEYPYALPCKLAFIAEAPSDVELRRGAPLVGPTGQLHDSLLRVAEIDRSEVYTDNVINVQLPKNDISPWCSNRTVAMKEGWFNDYPFTELRRGRFLRPEHWHHVHRVRRDILSLGPTILVAMGDISLWALCGVTGIQARRGFVTTSLPLDGKNATVKVLPTLHPAFLFHSPKAFTAIAADYCKAKRESEFPELRPPKRALWVDPTLEDLDLFKRQHIDGCDILSIDIETYPALHAITMVSFAPSPSVALCVPFADLSKPNRSFWSTAAEELVAVKFVKWLCESSTPKLFQNGPYDTQWLYEAWGIQTRNYIHDTRLAHHALYPELPKGLSWMASVYTDQGAWKMMKGKGQSEGRRDE